MGKPLRAVSVLRSAASSGVKGSAGAAGWSGGELGADPGSGWASVPRPATMSSGRWCDTNSFGYDSLRPRHCSVGFVRAVQGTHIRVRDPESRPAERSRWIEVNQRVAAARRLALDQPPANSCPRPRPSLARSQESGAAQDAHCPRPAPGVNRLAAQRRRWLAPDAVLAAFVVTTTFPIPLDTLIDRPTALARRSAAPSGADAGGTHARRRRAVPHAVT